jgi:hypothetical protein
MRTSPAPYITVAFIALIFLFSPPHFLGVCVQCKMPSPYRMPNATACPAGVRFRRAAQSARCFHPGDLCCSSVADRFNGEILRIDGKDQITTVAQMSGRFGFAGDGKHASSADTRDVSGLAIDRMGNVYLLDAGNRRVRVIRGVAR